MKRGRDFLDRLRADSGKLPIPESLTLSPWHVGHLPSKLIKYPQ